MGRYPGGASAGAGEGKMRVVDVWAHNQEAELDLIRSLLPEYPILAVISSSGVAAGYPSGAGADTPDTFYDYTRQKVEGQRFVQLALGLANHKSQLASRRIWRFNFGEFQPDDLRFFAQLGVEYPARRADPYRFGEVLMSCLAVLNPAVTWVISDGADQVAYLVKCLRGGLLLPPTRLGFLRICRAFFPTLYDIKVLTFSDANDSLKGRQPRPLTGDVGESFCAGLDAIMAGYTSFVSSLMLMQDPAFAKQMKSYNGSVFRLGDADTTTSAGPCYPDEGLARVSAVVTSHHSVISLCDDPSCMSNVN